MAKTQRKPFVNFFKILSDPAEGYGHLVNKIMTRRAKKDGARIEAGLDGDCQPLMLQLMQIFASRSSSCSDSKQASSAFSSGKHSDRLTLIRDVVDQGSS